MQAPVSHSGFSALIPSHLADALALAVRQRDPEARRYALSLLLSLASPDYFVSLAEGASLPNPLRAALRLAIADALEAPLSAHQAAALMTELRRVADPA